MNSLFVRILLGSLFVEMTALIPVCWYKGSRFLFNPIIYRTPFTFLQRPNQFAIGSQSWCYKITTKYLEDASNLYTGPHAIIYRTPAAFLQNSNQLLLGPSHLFYRTSTTYLEDPINFFTEPHPILYRTSGTILQDPNQFAVGPQQLFLQQASQLFKGSR